MRLMMDADISVTLHYLHYSLLVKQICGSLLPSSIVCKSSVHLTLAFWNVLRRLQSYCGKAILYCTIIGVRRLGIHTTVRQVLLWGSNLGVLVDIYFHLFIHLLFLWKIIISYVYLNTGNVHEMGWRMAGRNRLDWRTGSLLVEEDLQCSLTRQSKFTVCGVELMVGILYFFRKERQAFNILNTLALWNNCWISV